MNGVERKLRVLQREKRIFYVLRSLILMYVVYGNQITYYLDIAVADASSIHRSSIRVIEKAY